MLLWNSCLHVEVVFFSLLDTDGLGKLMVSSAGVPCMSVSISELVSTADFCSIVVSAVSGTDATNGVTSHALSKKKNLSSFVLSDP